MAIQLGYDLNNPVSGDGFVIAGDSVNTSVYGPNSGIIGFNPITGINSFTLTFPPSPDESEYWRVDRSGSVILPDGTVVPANTQANDPNGTLTEAGGTNVVPYSNDPTRWNLIGGATLNDGIFTIPPGAVIAQAVTTIAGDMTLWSNVTSVSGDLILRATDVSNFDTAFNSVGVHEVNYTGTGGAGSVSIRNDGVATQTVSFDWTQNEDSPYPTSRIPTSGAPASRAPVPLSAGAFDNSLGTTPLPSWIKDMLESTTSRYTVELDWFPWFDEGDIVGNFGILSMSGTNNNFIYCRGGGTAQLRALDSAVSLIAVALSWVGLTKYKILLRCGLDTDMRNIDDSGPATGLTPGERYFQIGYNNGSVTYGTPGSFTSFSNTTDLLRTFVNGSQQINNIKFEELP